MKEEILKILLRYKQDMESDAYYSANYGVSESDFEDVADDILELLKSLEINK